MDECLTAQQCEQYRYGTMDAASLQRADTHLRGCDRCRTALRMSIAPDTATADATALAIRRLLGTSRVAATLAVCPAPEELNRYVSHSASPVEQEIVKTHLADCALCRDDVAALTALQGEMESFGWDAARQGKATKAPFGLLASLSSFRFPSPPRFGLLQMGLAAVTITVLFVSSNLLLRSATKPLQERIARLEAEVRIVSQTASANTERLHKNQLSQDELRQRLAVQEARTQNATTKQRQAEAQASRAARETERLRLQLATRPSPAAPLMQEPSVIIALHDNRGTVTRDSVGNIRVHGKPLPRSLQKEVDAALRTGDAPLVGIAAELMRTPAAMVLRGNGQRNEAIDVPFALVSPLSVIVDTDRPTFHWKPFTPSAKYTVTVYDKAYNEIATSGWMTSTQWTVLIPLGRGESYTWRVTASENGKESVSPTTPAPEARFRILDASHSTMVRRSRLAPPYKDSPLLLGLLYARVGLVDAARQQFTILVKDNPDSLVAHRLLKSVSPALPSPISTNGAQ